MPPSLVSDIRARVRDDTNFDPLGSPHSHDPPILSTSSTMREILNGEREEWFVMHASTKSTGIFAKTSVEVLEAARLHWLNR